MLQIRQEIAALVKQASRNLKKTHEIQRELRSLMNYIDTVLARKVSPKRKAPR